MAEMLKVQAFAVFRSHCFMPVEVFAIVVNILVVTGGCDKAIARNYQDCVTQRLQPNLCLEVCEFFLFHSDPTCADVSFGMSKS